MIEKQAREWGFEADPEILQTQIQRTRDSFVRNFAKTSVSWLIAEIQEITNLWHTILHLVNDTHLTHTIGVLETLANEHTRNVLSELPIHARKGEHSGGLESDSLLVPFRQANLRTEKIILQACYYLEDRVAAYFAERRFTAFDPILRLSSFFQKV